MRDLLRDPLWRPEDLGEPIPDSSHAVSVCLPTWDDNIGYEERSPRVCDALRSGYPRFVFHPICRRLFEHCRQRFADEGEACIALSSMKAGRRLAAYLRHSCGHDARLHEFGLNGVAVATFPQRWADHARAYWQHVGDGVSSRLAEACLAGRTVDPADPAKRALRRRIADCTGVRPEHVWLFPTGMSAIFTVHQVLQARRRECCAVQFGFPYVDTLKVLQKFGAGGHFCPTGSADELDRLHRLLQYERISGVFTELPSNPLLLSPDLLGLAKRCFHHEVPLVVDDTVATWVNCDLLTVADVLCTSLTKSFSGEGDVAGGSVVINPRSRFAEQLAAGLDRVHEDLLCGADAEVLEQNSRDFVQRIPATCRAAERIAEHLRRHPMVAAVCYPKFQATGHYDRFRRSGAGYTSLLSLVLKNGQRTAPAFFDALQLSKGPNFGTRYSLACPYTILAHYHELGFAESCGVPPHLVRLSVGLEDADEIIDRLDDALDRARHAGAR